MDAFEDKMQHGGDSAIAHVGKFFMRDDPVHQSLREIARRLDDLSIDYAVLGGMALVAHGYDRTTVDVDVLISPDGLQAAHASLEGLGYVTLFAGSKTLRDTRTGVRIEFVVTGQYPGDGKPKPISFPDPAQVSEVIGHVRYVRLPTLVELKLASGMTNPGRLKDLADVQELTRALSLDESFADKLNPWVRDKFLELRAALQSNNP